MTGTCAFLRGRALARLGSWVVAGALIASLAGLSGAAPAQAQTQPQAWPQRPVKFILPFGAGSAIDVAARIISERLATRWGKGVVIENKPGADALLAIGAFTSANDDHVLLYSSSASFIAHPYLHEKLPYDLERDLAPIARISDTVLSASVTAASPYKTLDDFVAQARKAPNTLNAAGAAGLPEFTLGYFLKTLDLPVGKIPYRDIVPAATDLASGQIQFMVSSAATVQPLVQAGKIRMLAVTSRQRASFAPEVPTVVEAGYPSLALETVVGLFGPKIMARELRERVSADVVAVLSDPAIVARFAATGQVVRAGNPQELATSLKEQAERAAVVAAALGMKANK
jgi:tripartite-type tricarboxylate transporter receptor subunit TctC